MSEAAWCPEPNAAVPQQDRRQLIGCIAGSLAHLKWRPILLTGLLRQLLLHHFADPELIEEPDLRRAVWQSDSTTGILVETVQRWRGDLVGKRPALIVKRNGYKNHRVLRNDLVGRDKAGNDNFATLWVGSHTVFAINGTGAGTEILATEVQRELTQFGPMIGQSLNLHRFQVVEVGAVSVLEEATQNFIVPITVGWTYEETWRLEPDARPLQRFEFDLGARDL